jgi:predicted TIM-barrel fold metal-dependent hydrolase
MTIDAYCTLGMDREYDLVAERLLPEMEKAGVDRAVVAPVDRNLAVHNQAGNDYVLEAAARYPARLIPACSVNPWLGDEAVHELRRAVASGSRMLVLHPFVQGFVADDELVFPLIEVARAERIPIYIHTGPPGNATPWQVAGLARRFPGTDFIMGHCGATDFWNDVVVAARTADNCYLEASLARPFGFAGYIQQLGEAKGLMGSFAPINDLVFEWEQMRRVLPPGEFAGVYGGNLARLLEKRAPL